MHRQKQSLAYTKVRRDNLALVRAAEKQFGSWGVRRCMLPGLTPICIMFSASGAKQNRPARDQLTYANIFSPTVSAL